MENDNRTAEAEEIVKQLQGTPDGWKVAKILLDIRAIDKEEIAGAIVAAENAQKAKRLAIICCTIAVIAMLITGVVFAVLAAGIQIEHTVTTETVEQDAADGGNNTYIGEGAQYTITGSDQ